MNDQNPVVNLVTVPTAAGTSLRPSVEKVTGILSTLVGAWIAIGAPGASALPQGTDPAAVQTGLHAVTSWPGFVMFAMPLMTIGVSLWRSRNRNAKTGA